MKKIFLSAIAVTLHVVVFCQSKAVLVADVMPGQGSSYPQFLTKSGNFFYFMAEDATHGYELWKSDGTLTSLVKDINPGSNSSNAGFFYSPGTTAGNMISVNGGLFFTADDGSHGIELWKINDVGSAEMVKDINPGLEDGLSLSGEESPHINLVAVSSTSIKFFFAANDGVNGYELWVSDGTKAGTVMLEINKQNFNNFGSSPKFLTAVNELLYFSATDEKHGTELWQSDGTRAGTKMVKDINPNPAYQSKTDTVGEGSDPMTLFNANGVLYFSADEGVTWSGNTFFGKGRELWKYEPVAKSASLVSDINAGKGNSNPGNFTVGNGRLFLTADAGTGTELWSFLLPGGTPQIVKDINPAGPSNPVYLTMLNQKLFFNADDGVHGKELWMSDGTVNGTVMRADIRAGAASGNPRSMTTIGTTLYFTADDGTWGRELWEGNETALPIMTDDILKGSNGSYPESLLNMNGSLYFSAETSASGYELMTLAAKSSTVTTVAAGDWSNAAIWQNGVVPGATAAVSIKHAITVSKNASCLSVNVEKTGSLKILKGIKLLVKK